MGVLKRCETDSEWSDTCFITNKKNWTVTIIINFRELNKRIQEKPWPMLKIMNYLDDIK